MSTIAILGYWDIRGLAEPIRLLLEYGGISYEDRRYQMSKPTWLQFKPSLGYDFPNLPYYQDEEVKITQSKAILCHLGRKLGLQGSTLGAEAEVDMMLGTVADYTQVVTGLCYRPDFNEDIKSQWITGTGEYQSLGSLENRLQDLQKKLGSNDWFVNNELSVADFAVWELLDGCRLLFPGCLATLPALSNFMLRFAELTGVKEYLQAPRYRPFPVWSVRAKYGYYPVK